MPVIVRIFNLILKSGSILSACVQYVKVKDTLSHSFPLIQGVCQGSVLGPIWYSLYTSPLGDIAKYHKMNFHLYADDTQLYISFETSCINEMEPSKSRVEACVCDIDLWMVQNRLKLDQDKTEVLVFSSRYHSRPNIHDLTIIVDEVVNCCSTAKDIGVTLDELLSMTPHVTVVCNSPIFFHVRNISKITKFLNMETRKSLLHAFITSKVNSCNFLLYGVPKYLLLWLRVLSVLRE